MKQIKISRTKIKSQIIRQIVFLLKKGGIIVYPTETAYAIGGDALKKEVIKKIFLLKARTKKNPLPVIVGTSKQAQRIAIFNQNSKKLAEKYWPGPFTLVLRKKKVIPSSLTVGENKVAVRIPGSWLAREIAKRLKHPLISTSANLSGQKECYTIRAVLKQLPKIKKRVDLILDAGRLPKVRPSTVVEASGNKLNILREGPVELKDLRL